MSFPSMDDMSRRSRYAAYDINEDGSLREMQLLSSSNKANTPVPVAGRSPGSLSPAIGAAAGVGGNGSGASKKRKVEEMGAVKKEKEQRPKKPKPATGKDKTSSEPSSAAPAKKSSKSSSSATTEKSSSRSASKPKRPRAISPGPEPDPQNSIMLYQDVNNPPPPFIVRISTEPTHADARMKISEDGMTTFTDK
ncbi:hypothetical protein HDU67_005588, partial [Dinochytrium kinnereticum]